MRRYAAAPDMCNIRGLTEVAGLKGTDANRNPIAEFTGKLNASVER
jgi:hypothetical protein